MGEGLYRIENNDPLKAYAKYEVDNVSPFDSKIACQQKHIFDTH